MRGSFRRAVTVFSFWAMGQVAAAQTIQAAASQAGALDGQGSSARALAMGSAFVAVAGDPTALYFNPAGLAPVLSPRLSLQHESYLAGTFQEALLYGFPLDKADGLALGFHYVHWGTLDLRDANGMSQGTYTDGDFALLAGWGREWFPHFSVGLTLKALQQKVVDNLYNELSADLGVLWQPLEGLSLGASYNDLGTALNGYALSQRLLGGGSYRWSFSKEGELLASLQGDWQVEGISRLAAGVEGSWNRQFFLRAGYQWPLDGQIAGGGAAYSLGAGVNWRDFSLDYAFIPYGDFGASHALSLAYQFPLSKPEVVQVPVTVIEKVAVTAPPPEPTPDLNGMGTPAVQLKFKVPTGASEGVSVVNSPGEDPEVQKDLDLVKANPQDPAPWWRLGTHYFNTRQKDQAIQCFEQVLRLRPNEEKLKAWLDQYKAAP